MSKLKHLLAALAVLVLSTSPGWCTDPVDYSTIIPAMTTAMGTTLGSIATPLMGLFALFLGFGIAIRLIRRIAKVV